MDGIVLIDKPVGPSAFDAVKVVRRNYSTLRVGHAGTLDPMASGLMVICAGRYTRLVPFLQETVKVYRAVIRLGQATACDDVEGAVIEEKPVPPLTVEQVEFTLRQFEGEQTQVPPLFSALKKNGVRLYEMARQGRDIVLPGRTVQIDQVSFVSWTTPFLEIEVTCQKGTYIRSLARDVGIALGTVAHLYSLRRTRTSGFSVDEAVSMDALSAEKDPDVLKRYVIPAASALRMLQQTALRKSDEKTALNGGALLLADYPEIAPGAQNVCLIDGEGDLRAIVSAQGDALQPVRVFP